MYVQVRQDKPIDIGDHRISQPCPPEELEFRLVGVQSVKHQGQSIESTLRGRQLICMKMDRTHPNGEFSSQHTERKRQLGVGWGRLSFGNSRTVTSPRFISQPHQHHTITVKGTSWMYSQMQSPPHCACTYQADARTERSDCKAPERNFEIHLDG